MLISKKRKKNRTENTKITKSCASKKLLMKKADMTRGRTALYREHYLEQIIQEWTN